MMQVLQHRERDATVAPAVTDDSGSGYAVGSKWLDVTADEAYECLDATSGAAVWKGTTSAGGGGFSDPMTTRGDIIFKNASNVTTRLPVGTVGQVFTSDGTDASWGSTVDSSLTVTGDLNVGDSGTSWSKILFPAAPSGYQKYIDASTIATSLVIACDGVNVSSHQKITMTGTTGKTTIATGLGVDTTAAAKTLLLQRNGLSSSTYANELGLSFRHWEISGTASRTQVDFSASHATTETNNVMSMRSTGAISMGQSSLPTGLNSLAIGQAGTTNNIHSKFAIGTHTTVGKGQSGITTLNVETTDATQTTITSDQAAASATNQLILPDLSAQSFYAIIVGNDGGSAAVMFDVVGLIRRGANASTTALVGTPTVTQLFTDASLSASSIAVVADTTNGGLSVKATGIAATTISWTCTIKTAEAT